MPKNDMKSTDYYKSGKHSENFLAAAAKGLAKQLENKQKRIDEYEANPTCCAECGKALPYHRKREKFCGRSCAAKFNNARRDPRTEESKKKTADAMKGNIPWSKGLKLVHHADVEFTCPICLITKLVPYDKRNNKTCGDEDCRVQASVGVRTYQNGSRKPVWFFNPYEDKEVLLESSWEIETAKYLIDNNVEWIRPKFIKWVDGTGKTRRYFPDFYLPKYNVYLDPKNPYCMKKDEEKMAMVTQSNTVIYGDIKIIKEWVDKTIYRGVEK